MITKNKLYVVLPVFVLLGILLLGMSLSKTTTALAAYPTLTRTRTSTAGPSLTPTRTPTGPVLTATPTATQASGAVCSPLTATITAPFVFETIGGPTSNEFCWRISAMSTMNSFGLDVLTVNGVNFLNQWVSTSSPAFPAKIGGYWYIHYVAINKFTQHFDAQP